MTAEEMTAEAEKHFAAIRAAIHDNQVAWAPAESPDGSTSYQGFLPGYVIIVIRTADGAQLDGAITTTGQFSLIRLNQATAKICFEAGARECRKR